MPTAASKPARSQRLDSYLVESGDYPSREQARRGILAGEVTVENAARPTPGMRVKGTEKIAVKRRGGRFVSRGGDKLQAALDAWHIDVAGVRAIDVGASTGGFTDCLLRAGAARVVAVDVGYGQLDWGLRDDERVTVLERTNIRHLEPSQLPFQPEFAVIDVSFISLKQVLPHVLELLVPQGKTISLVKPQFEAGRGQVGKGGVIRKREIHLEVLRGLVEFCRDTGIAVDSLMPSPLKGPAGNIEFLMAARKGAGWPEAEDIEQVVERAWTST
ncbi:MAG: TlyA family RNA methyltransferase [Candidatus Geothermincolia bacterium]